jgi:hypothetical protein
MPQPNCHACGRPYSELDLDAIESRRQVAWEQARPNYGAHGYLNHLLCDDVPALISEVERLRTELGNKICHKSGSNATERPRASDGNIR